MLGQKKRLEPKLFYTGFTLEDRIPADHKLRRIREQIDFQFVRSEVKHLYGDCGHESIDPIVLVKLMLLLFLEQVKSERALMEQMPCRLDWLWFCEYDVDEELPDHSVLSKARRRWGASVFVTLFQRVLRQCVDAGLVDGSVIHIDGSVIRSDASMDSLQPHLALASESLYEQLEAGLETANINDASASALKQPLVSTTDPDARMTRKNGKSVLGYKEHRAVDDAHGIVTATVTTDAAVSEAHKLVEVLNRHRWNSGLVEQTVVADKGYGTRESYKALYERGATPCIPHQKHGGKHGTYSTARFKYDRKQDCYVCPSGHVLRRRPGRVRAKGSSVRYYAESAACNGCPLRTECTRNAQGRTVVRHVDQWYVDWADECGSSHERRRLMGRRLAVVEGSFADAGNNHCFKRARWRGLDQVEIQNHLIATVQNVRKLISAGRRVKPRRRVSAAMRSLSASRSPSANTHSSFYRESNVPNRRNAKNRTHRPFFCGN